LISAEETNQPNNQAPKPTAAPTQTAPNTSLVVSTQLNVHNIHQTS
jgi:hypothetical protein